MRFLRCDFSKYQSREIPFLTLQFIGKERFVFGARIRSRSQKSFKDQTLRVFKTLRVSLGNDRTLRQGRFFRV